MEWLIDYNYLRHAQLQLWINKITIQSITVTGVYGKSTTPFLSSLAKKLVGMSGHPRERQCFYLHVSLAVVKGNTASILACMQDWSSSSFEWVVTIHCLASLDLRAGVQQPFDCVIIQNHQAVQSIWSLMDWTLEDNMVDSLFFCGTLIGCKGGHTPFVQAVAKMFDTSVEAVKLNLHCSWNGHSRRVVACLGDKCTEFRSVV